MQTATQKPNFEREAHTLALILAHPSHSHGKLCVWGGGCLLAACSRVKEEKGNIESANASVDKLTNEDTDFTNADKALTLAAFQAAADFNNAVLQKLGVSPFSCLGYMHLPSMHFPTSAPSANTLFFERRVCFSKRLPTST